ncbi:MAG: hypothetical protein EAZ49_07425 [Oscillatoriales cyanobacterium]|nr:MAG: hypothetical protein EAZ49_07425 [Oscillatoriales cyanobacterium]
MFAGCSGNIKKTIFLSINMFVGAKHDRSEYKIITNNLYAVMLRPLQKPDAPICFPALAGARNQSIVQ